MADAGLPDWETVRELLMSPKPPVSATVYAIGKPVAHVVTDGFGGWWIDEGADRLLQAEPGRALFIEEERFHLVVGFDHVSLPGWITPNIEPRRYPDLREASGAVVRVSPWPGARPWWRTWRV